MVQVETHYSVMRDYASGIVSIAIAVSHQKCLRDSRQFHLAYEFSA